MHEVTQILSAIEQGDSGAAEHLLPLVYNELRRLACEMMARETPGQTLQTTALVHEAYIRLVDVERAQRWDSRGHFFAAAAEAMRRILTENARRKKSLKRGGAVKRINLEDPELSLECPAEDSLRADDLLALDEALGKLARENQPAAEVAKLRLFAGLTVDEAANILGISRRTAYRHWTYARAFLQIEMRGASGG